MDLQKSSEGKTEKPASAKSVSSPLSTSSKPGFEWDKNLPHFGVRILPSGERRWVVVKRPAGSTRVVIVTLGSCDALKRKEAEKLAYKTIAKLAEGINPNAIKKETRKAERAAKAEATNTFLHVGRSYLRRCEDKGRRQTTIAEYHRMLHGDDLQPLHARPINGISAKELEGLIGRVQARAPVQANRTLELLSAVFKHGLRKGAIPIDPVARLDRDELRHREKSRKRTLIHPYTNDPSELIAVWQGAEMIEPAHHPLRAMVQLLILTGVRVGVLARSHPGQVGALTWRHVKDLNRPQHARLEIPPALRKTGDNDDDIQVIPLPPLAVKILNRLAKVGDDAPVFTVTGSRPIKIDDGVRDQLRKLANKAAGKELEHWTLHDLRRSMATGLGHLGTPHAIIDEILDHAGEAKAGIRGTYDRSQRVALCREWLTKWADHLKKAATKGR